MASNKSPIDQGGSSTDNHSQNMGLGYLRIFRADTLYELRLGYNRPTYLILQDGAFQKDYAAILGIKNLLRDPVGWGVPQIGLYGFQRHRERHEPDHPGLQRLPVDQPPQRDPRRAQPESGRGGTQDQLQRPQRALRPGLVQFSGRHDRRPAAALGYRRFRGGPLARPAALGLRLGDLAGRQHERIQLRVLRCRTTGRSGGGSR